MIDSQTTNLPSSGDEGPQPRVNGAHPVGVALAPSLSFQLPNNSPWSVRLGLSQWMDSDRQRGFHVGAIAMAAYGAGRESSKFRALRHRFLIRRAASARDDATVRDALAVANRVAATEAWLKRHGPCDVGFSLVLTATCVVLIVWGALISARAVAVHQLLTAGVFSAFAIFIAGILSYDWGQRSGRKQLLWLSAWAALCERRDEDERRRNEAERRRAAMLPCPMNVNLPVAQWGTGYLYVIQFSTGAVKVGQTVDPRGRLADHRRDAEAYKVAIVNYWVSPVHAGHLANEAALIARCVKISPRARKEYFHAVSFADTVAFASDLVNRSIRASGGVR